MDARRRQQQESYNRAWLTSIEQGRDERGNQEVNIRFLAESGLFRPGTRVLEIGCGTGYVTHWLAGRGCEAIGTDLSEVAIGRGCEKYPGLELRVSSAEELGFADASFDLVVSFDLLEHLYGPDEHVAETARVLRPGGSYLVGTPNKWCSAFFDTVRHRGFGWKWSHPSLQSCGQLRRLLARHGLECEFVRMNTVGEFSLGKLERQGWRWLTPLVRRIDTSVLPVRLQTNLYARGLKAAGC